MMGREGSAAALMEAMSTARPPGEAEEPGIPSFSINLRMGRMNKHRTVDPKVGGSRPLTHPTLFASKFNHLPCFFLSAPIP